jgi:hypothetical protein
VPAFDHLTPAATRARVAVAIDDLLHGVDMAAALLVADTLDAVSAASCRAAGLTDEEARSILGLLWEQR